MRILIATLTAVFVLMGAFAGGTGAFAEEPVWTKGKITKVKPDQGKVTVKHEEITNLDMPAMKMVFRVEDPALLERLKTGDEHEFYFVKDKGRFTIKSIKE